MISHRYKNNKIPIDFIGRFERLSQDFDYVCEKLNLSMDELPRMVAGEESASYIDAYDPATIAVIARIYAPEITLFGYRFSE